MCHPDFESCLLGLRAVAFCGGAAENGSAMTCSDKAAENEPCVCEWDFLVQTLKAQKSVHCTDINLLPWKKQQGDGSPGVYLAQSM